MRLLAVSLFFISAVSFAEFINPSSIDLEAHPSSLDDIVYFMKAKGQGTAIAPNGTVAGFKKVVTEESIDGIKRMVESEVPMFWNPETGKHIVIPNLKGYTYTEVRDINKHEWVVGTSRRAQIPHQMAVLWMEDRGSIKLPPLPEDHASAAKAVSDRNIVGASFGNGMRPVIWQETEKGWKATLLPHEKDISVPYGISDNGKFVVGHDGARAVLWTRTVTGWEKTIIDNKISAKAFHVNNSGQVAGHLTEIKKIGKSNMIITEAFIWSAKRGKIERLGFRPGDYISQVRGINNDGAIVGVSKTTRDIRSFIWDEELGLRPIAGLALRGTVITGINDDWSVTGYDSTPLAFIRYWPE